MSTGFETLDVIEPWLIAVLKDALINMVEPNLVNTVVNAQTTEKVTPPYLVVGHISSRDILGIGMTRFDTDNLYGVKVIHTGNSFVPGRVVLRAVEAAINGKVITTVNGNLTCVREASFHYPETIDGVQYMHVGANYRIRASSS
jgi:hypothetical protein